MKASGYDNRTAIFLASVCSQTYAHYNNPDGSFVMPESYEPVADILAESLTGVTERFGFIIQSPEYAIIAFRGTSSTTDWVSDAMASQSKYKCVKNAGQSHRGISNIYYSARECVLKALREISTDKTLYITGHSLGGALATLCALDISTNTLFGNPGVYTYGSPRVGDPTFAKTFNNRLRYSYRINNRFDVVTHLPPQAFKLPKRTRTYYYKHVAQSEMLSFHNGSIPGNHVISSYYFVLAEGDPAYAAQLSRANPGLCPAYARYGLRDFEQAGGDRH
ncbi:lipase family protein [Cohnella lupini]|uniref:Triacylglycerol lipase n=1 Tax=Cohnella lupini TaxID=1294267 RepID=A0A3D9IQB6_9BACL|nr:lipase family protein [Cohnella lupini]RED63952.1 triacylglycerol lipase [Cohnella lupini]